MSERVEPQAKTSSTPITAQTHPQLQPRSFSAEVTPAPTEQTEQPDLQTQLERAERFGHNFANIPIFAPDTQPPPPPLQPQLIIRQPGDDSEQEVVQLMRIPNLATQPSSQRQLSEQSKSPLADYMRRVAQAEQPQPIQRKSLLQRRAESHEASSEMETQLNTKLQPIGERIQRGDPKKPAESKLFFTRPVTEDMLSWTPEELAAHMFSSVLNRSQTMYANRWSVTSPIRFILN